MCRELSGIACACVYETILGLLRGMLHLEDAALDGAKQVYLCCDFPSRQRNHWFNPQCVRTTKPPKVYPMICAVSSSKERALHKISPSVCKLPSTQPINPIVSHRQPRTVGHIPWTNEKNPERIYAMEGCMWHGWRQSTMSQIVDARVTCVTTA